MKNNLRQFVKNSLLTTFLIMAAHQTYSQTIINTDKFNMNSTNLVVNSDVRATNSSVTLLRQNSVTGFPNQSWSIVNEGNVLSFTNASPTGNFTDVGGFRMRYLLPAASSPTSSGNIGLEVRDNLYVGGLLQVNNISANGLSRPNFPQGIEVNRDGTSSIIIKATDETNGNPAEISFNKDTGSQRAAVGVSGANRDFFIWVNNADRFNISETGRGRFPGQFSVGGGVISTDYTLVSAASWSDFVFNKDYKLPSLKETESFIKANGHLPNIPSEKEVKENGYNLHEMNTKFLQTIEELTLHSIEQEKKIEQQASEIEKMKQELESIKKMLLDKK